jgi:hypothetical protein
VSRRDTGYWDLPYTAGACIKLIDDPVIHWRTHANRAVEWLRGSERWRPDCMYAAGDDGACMEPTGSNNVADVTCLACAALAGTRHERSY